MKTCHECGFELSVEANFCKNCGTKQNKKEILFIEPEIIKEISRNKNPEVKKKETAFFKQFFEAMFLINNIFDVDEDKETKQNINKLEKKCLKIYEKLPQNNCGKCDCKNCYSFALQMAGFSLNSKKKLSDCHFIRDKTEIPIGSNNKEFSFWEIFFDIWMDITHGINDIVERKEMYDKIQNILLKTPQSDCGKCGCKYCFIFALQVLAEEKILHDCPYIKGNKDQKRRNK